MVSRTGSRIHTIGAMLSVGSKLGERGGGELLGFGRLGLELHHQLLNGPGARDCHRRGSDKAWSQMGD